METLKAILNFFKQKKVRLWAGIMAGVIIMAAGIMSWVMVSDKVVFSQISAGDGTLFDFVPDITYIDTITISNNNESLSRNVQLNNNVISGNYDSVIFGSEAKAVKEILKRLDNGRQTNSFLQFFTGGESGDQKLTYSYTGNSTFEDTSKGVWVKIVFATAQYALNRDNNISPWRIEKYDPNYTRPKDENGNDYGQTSDHYHKSVVNAISIPLGNVNNKVTQQTWYLSIGNQNISNKANSLGYKFTTYGNYHNLLKYVNAIDDEFFY